tara:strand:+ start:702 stop:998 length:297 start_codon:yes stop_codon:yes gene_type:complete
MFVREDIHAAKEQKKKHSRVRMQLESAQNDLESAKANKKVTNERKAELEEVYAMAQTSYQESEFESISVMLDCTKSSEFIVAEAMIEDFEISLGYHQV